MVKTASSSIIPSSPLRVLFAGTPEFSLPPLRVLLAGDCEIVAVLTQPDRPAGRGKHLSASPVKQLALKNNVEVLQPASLNESQWLQRLENLRPDLLLVVAYGLMIPAKLLALPLLGGWNIHASLLPRWRGAAPIQRAVEAGDRQTGVCIMKMEATLDTGPVYHCLTTPIEQQDTAGTLHDRLAEMGAQALTHCLELALTGGLSQPLAQDHSKAVYAQKLSKAEAELNWNQPAEILQRQIRAFNPWPIAWCELAGQRVRIWRAEVVEGTPDCEPGSVVVLENSSLIIGTADKALKILEIQRAGGKRLSAAAFLQAQGGKGF